MKNDPTTDIYEMLDTLSLPVAAQRFMELSKSPELGSYTALQFVREVLEPQYIETLNNRFETNLRLSSLINKGAMAENLKTGNGRIYNDATVEQILKFHFAGKPTECRDLWSDRCRQVLLSFCLLCRSLQT